jgi:hypothetical protein
VLTRHGRLWAYNLDQLMLIRNYVDATLRERANWYDTWQNTSLVSRLPIWIKRGKNRQELLRIIDKLQAAFQGA